MRIVDTRDKPSHSVILQQVQDERKGGCFRYAEVG